MNRYFILISISFLWLFTINFSLKSQIQSHDLLDSLFLSLPENAYDADAQLKEIKEIVFDLDEKERYKYYVKIGDKYRTSEIFDSAYIFYDIGKSLAIKYKDKYLQAYFNYRQARIDIALANYTTALDMLLKAKEIYSHKDSTKFMCNIDRNIGNAYWGLGIYDRALELYMGCLVIAKKEGFVDDIASSLNNIGLIYSEYGDSVNERIYYLQALKMADENGFKWLSAASSNNLGSYYDKNRMYDSAMYYFKYSGKLARELGGKLHEGITLFNIGDLYLKIDSLDLSRKYLNESLKLAIETSDKIGISECMIALGKAYLSEGLPNMAISYLDSGLLVAKEIKSFDLQARAQSLKTEYFFQKEEFQSAYNSQKLFMNTKDSLNEQNNAEALTRVEYKFLEERNEIEISALKKQREIIILLIIHVIIALIVIIIVIWSFLKKTRRNNKLLEQQNIEIDKQKELLFTKNEDLLASEKELQELVYGKDQFITIISHDLKNPVSAIRGFVELLIKEYDNISEEKKKMFLKQVFESIEKTSLLINNILYWVRSQTKGIKSQPAPIPLKKSIKNNISLYTIIAGDKGISLVNDIPDSLMINADSNIFDTIVRNLLSNSIKYTKQNGEINFRAIHSENSILFTIADNGIGMSKDKLEEILSTEKLKSTPGTNHEQGTGLGLNLVKDFAKLINAEFTIDSEIDKGTSYHLKFIIS